MLEKPKIKTMVIDDSLVFRKFLIEKLPLAQSRIEVVGYAVDAFDAMRKIPKLNPDVITLDVEMPRMNGIDFLDELLPKHQIPVILVSSLNIRVFDALSHGAVDFVKKPDMQAENSASVFVRNLANKVIVASQAKVKLPASARATQVRQNTQMVPSKGGHPTTGRAVSRQMGPLPGEGVKLTSTANMKLDNTVIAIGASTGGTEATLDVLKQLPANVPGIVITQHMPKGFTTMYAERLNRLCRISVKEAEDGDVIRRGVALLAPGGDLQMKVVKKGQQYRVHCYPGEKVNGHRPSVDVLFQSVAETARQNAVGILLTGMGSDGAQGLLKMRRAGAYTIGQDKESSVVYGMPAVAYDIGAVCAQASCTSIANVLMKHLNHF